MDELADSRVGSTVGGRYRITSVLAAGGMGVVYRAEDTRSSAPVAVKFLHAALVPFPDLVKRFRREAAALDLLSHPNLVSVIDSGVEAGAPFLVMDLHEGRPLGDLLDSLTALPAVRAVSITRQILSGVASAHGQAVVHRDLKPDNIMLLDENGRDVVKVLDFGLAKVLHENPDQATRLTNTGFALGTPGYMSPEQAQGLPTDGRADLYAVGVMLYHMVAGRKPFVADVPLAVVRMHIDDPPPPPRRVSPHRGCSVELEQVIMRALEKKPADRWPTAESFSEALGGTPEGRGESMPPVRPQNDPAPTVAGRRREARTPRRPFRMPVAGLIKLLVFATLAGGLALGWTQLSIKTQRRARRALDETGRAVQSAWQALTAPSEVAPDPLIAVPKGTGSATSVAGAQAAAGTHHPGAENPTAAQNPGEPNGAQAMGKPSNGAGTQGGSGEAAPSDDDDGEEEPAKAVDGPGAKLEASSKTPAAPPAKAKLPSVQDAARLLAAGKTDEAVLLLYAVRRRAPKSAEVALLLGHAYFRKLWRSDGLREYDTAVQLRPIARREFLVQRNAVAALEGNAHRMARAFIKNRLGAAAVPELRRAARVGRSALLQRRASRLADQLSRRPSRRR